MSVKHIFNNPNEALISALRSTSALNPSVAADTESGVAYDTLPPSPHRSVSVLAGGGSGHEPCHVNLVGRGLLQASVSGHIFASPSSTQILQAVHRTPPTHAILLVINQYTGDKLNFNLAAQRARHEGRVVHTVTVGDDVSLPPAAIAKVGRRGLTANPLVCKVAGAASERGLDVEGVRRISEAVAANVGTIGVSPQHCHVPGRGVSEGTEDAMYAELGLGIHNEPGAKVIKDTHTPTQLVEEMVDKILTSPYVEYTHSDKVILIINNLGGLSLLELYAVVGVAGEVLAKHSIHPIRTLVGSFMTSLNMPGFSLSLLNVTNADKMCGGVAGVSVAELLQDPTAVCAWPGMSVEVPDLERCRKDEVKDEVQAPPPLHTPCTEREHFIARAIKSACDAILAVEPELTRWDTVVGDGDCGTTLSSGAMAIMKAIEESRIPLSDYAKLFHALSLIVEGSMGGTAGALFALYFGALSNTVSDDLPTAAQDALEELAMFTTARVGDRTLMDALEPFCEALGSGVTNAAEAARRGAEKTASMPATLGRAAYCTSSSPSHAVPDPGAMGVSAIASGIARCF